MAYSYQQSNQSCSSIRACQSAVPLIYNNPINTIDPSVPPSLTITKIQLTQAEIDMEREVCGSVGMWMEAEVVNILDVYYLLIIKYGININYMRWIEIQLIIFIFKQEKTMHNYNPINKYSMRTRMGNWSEEWDLEETKRKEYLRQKNTGVAKVSDRERILMQSLQSASLTYTKDGFRRFGDHVMLFNGKSEGFLVTDIFDRLLNTEESYNVSSVKKIHAAARSVFIIERADPNDGYKDNVVHYGQKLRIRINPILLDKPIYLYSEPASVNRYSKVSRLQQVIFMLKNNYNTVWMIEHPDPNERPESVGQPVRTDDSVLFKHEMTNQWLASDTKSYKNTFGEEFQVMAHNFLVQNKSQNLIQERRGISTIDIPSRAQKDENLWLIVGASSAEQQFDEKAIKNQVVTKSFLDKKMKHLLTERGIYGVRFLHKVFRCLDKEQKGSLDQQDFRWGLQSGKLFLSEEEVNFIVKQYAGKDGVSYKLFLKELRGKLNQNRMQAISDAYKRAQKVIGKKTTLEELGRIYDAKKHPEVLTQKKSEKEAFNEFIWSWDNIKPDYVVQIQQFAAYFEDISAMIPRDEHFEYLLLNVFHM